MNQRVSALDGLRAVAVLAVMCFHSSFAWATGGGYGVDVFFALSGFLITSILLKEYDSKGSIDFRRFYVRRCLRLLPALVCVVVACCVIEQLMGPFDDGPSVWMRSVWTMAYISNWVWAFKGGSILGALNAPWSLAIEEQFYLLFPVCLLLMFWARMSRQQIAVVLAVVVAYSILWEWWLHRTGASWFRTYAGTDIRGGVILMGCVVALTLPDLKKILPRRGLTAFGFICLAILLRILSTGPLFPSTRLAYLHRAIVGFLTLVIVLVAMLSEKGMVSRLLSFGPLVYVGQISYGIYLWHGSANLYLGRYWPHMPMTIHIATGLLLAVISYHVVEVRFLRLKDATTAPPKLVPVAGEA